jgi:saccharopine dehydrogenase-like NADP-dependent oxidoreductase
MALIRVDAHGVRNGKEKRVLFQLLDRKDPATGLTAMQRTVGFTLSLGARLILDGTIEKRGLVSPLDLPYEAVFPSLEKHGIRVRRSES